MHPATRVFKHALKAPDRRKERKQRELQEQLLKHFLEWELNKRRSKLLDETTNRRA